MGELRDTFWELPLAVDLSRVGVLLMAGMRFLHKIEDAGMATKTPMLLANCLIRAVRNAPTIDRKAYVPDCLRQLWRLSRCAMAASTCAYRLRAQERPLPSYTTLSAATERMWFDRASLSLAAW